MMEKISFALKLKERLSGKNLILNALSKLPKPTLEELKSGRLRPLLLYEKNIYPVQISIVDDSTFTINKEGLPKLKPFEVFLLILPQESVRYVFQSKLSKEEEHTYVATILDPRSEPRFSISRPVPSFLSFVPPPYVNKLLSNVHYYLVRETNFSSSEDFFSMKEIYLYDLVLDERSMIEEEFKKLVHKVFLTGILKNLSRSGACVTTKGKINLMEETLVFYLRFEIPTKGRLIKFSIFSLLRDLSYQDENTNLHFNYLIGIKPEIWAPIEEDLKATYQAQG